MLLSQIMTLKAIFQYVHRFYFEFAHKHSKIATSLLVQVKLSLKKETEPDLEKTNKNFPIKDIILISKLFFPVVFSFFKIKTERKPDFFNTKRNHEIICSWPFKTLLFIYNFRC